MSTASAAPTGLIILIGALIGLGIYFAPSALAILRGNVFKGQVIKFQIIILVITIVVVALVSVLGLFLPATAGIERNEMTGNMAAVTDDATMAEPEVEASTASSASGARLLSTLCIIGGGIWALISIVLWFYILIHVLRDQQMTLLSRFGINI